MAARVHHEWLQKHPTPRASDGDFHWYPGEEPAAALAEIAAGATAPLTLWLSPARVIAARRFHAIAPGDARRYAGLAVAIADAGGLAALPVPIAQPWTGDAGAPVPRIAVVEVSASLVAAVWRGGAARAPIESAPAACAAIEAWLPRPPVRRIAIDPDAPEPALAPDIADLARWLAAAVTAHGAARDRARRAWQAVAALAAVEERSIESMFAELGALDRACSTAAALRAYLAARGITVGPRFHSDPDGAAQWSRALHGWGRGRVAATTAELGALLARRAVADRLAGVDTQDWRAVLHWRSMLPAARAADLERAALARLPLLAEARRG